MKFSERTYTVYNLADVAYSGDCLNAAAEQARACHQAQITSPAWGDGYVTTFVEGGAAAKYFAGHNAHGFGGEIPADAAKLVALLK